MKRYFLSALLAGAAFTYVDSATLAAPVQWKVEDGGNGHYYEVVSVPGGISWTDAKAAAELGGGYLATITSQEENDFVYSLVDNDIYWGVFGSVRVNGPWLGGFHEAVGIPSEWKWVTGEPFTYSNWDSTQPDYLIASGQTQNALHFYGFGTSLGDRTPMWDDDWQFSVNELAYVVETVPEPSSIALLGIACAAFAYQALRRGKRRFDQTA